MARITYRRARRLPPGAVRALFKRNGFYDWFTLADTEWYLRHALFVASAWDGRRAVGIATLTGDGRVNVELDALVVDEDYRRRGIGGGLLETAVAKAETLKPHHFQAQVHERSTERFYGKFGFTRNRSTWLVEHAPTANRLRALARKHGK
ncbi:MAG TPA: GNAT family N-acetyltransferase [Planctomycetota bacterium]|nr:GNAT family N-acetyltransferase [Planctomycetota bacterium]